MIRVLLSENTPGAGPDGSTTKSGCSIDLHRYEWYGRLPGLLHSQSSGPQDRLHTDSATRQQQPGDLAKSDEFRGPRLANSGGQQRGTA